MRAFLRTISIVLLVAWMALIFYLSSQPAEVSSETSGTVIEIIAEKFYPDFENLTEAEQQEVIESFQFAARKTAHVCVYAVLGVLSLLALISYRRLHMSTRVAISIVISALYAASDEYHQKFVEGRSAELRDLLLDIGGAVAGILLTLLLVRIISPWYRKVRYKKPSKKMSMAAAAVAAGTAVTLPAFESGIIDSSRNINDGQKADPIFDEIFAEPEEIEEGETVMEEPLEITEEQQEIPEEVIEEVAEEIPEEEIIGEEAQEIAEEIPQEISEEELPAEEITDQAEICEEEISEEICEETEQEEIPEELPEKEPESSYKNVKPEEIDYAASVIGKSVVEVTKVCNKITADSNGNDTKELINLALGRNEVFKSSVFGILCEGIDFEEKKRKIEDERKDAFDYFASILAQIC